ncbi:Hypothetical predicted protein [Lecanosticta acicola]|uniref:Uncharacterized protein n=1 Tax=Lecanosticta acicola TaxID=111012 RepID=A0AAI8YYW6_9PEZI|nr:Hypothetical predicted protein [Lecanosticta acicola]
MSSIQSTDSAGPIAIAPIIFNNFALTLSISEHKVMILYNALLLTLAYLTALFGSNFIFQQLHSLCRLRQPGEGDIQYGARKPMTSLQQPPSHWNYSRRLAGMYILITMLVSVPECERYNRYAAFLDPEGTFEVPKQCAEKVKNDLSEIEHIMRDASRAIEEKVLQLQKNTSQFLQDVAVHSGPRWYRNVEDLTADEDSHFVEILNTMDFPDVPDFCAYLEETLPLAAAKRRPDHEYSGRRFVGKVHLLLQRVMQGYANNYPLALSLFVVVKSKVLQRSNPRVLRAYPTEEKYVNDTINWLLDQRDLHGSPDEYWDFATHWRAMLHTWKPSSPHFNGGLGALLDLLERFRQKAESEIRHRTLIAVNGRLPTELADLVFEFAMLVEEVPLE